MNWVSVFTPKGLHPTSQGRASRTLGILALLDFTPKGLHPTAQGRASRTLGYENCLIANYPEGVTQEIRGHQLYNPFGVAELVVANRSQGARSATLGYGVQPLRGKDKDQIVEAEFGDANRSQGARGATLGYGVQPLRGKDKDRMMEAAA